MIANLNVDYNKSQTPEDVNISIYTGSLIRHSDIHVKLSPELPCPEQHSKGEYRLNS